MRSLFWNARKRQGYISTHKIEVIVLQETIKFDFTNRDLRLLALTILCGDGLLQMTDLEAFSWESRWTPLRLKNVTFIIFVWNLFLEKD